MKTYKDRVNNTGPVKTGNNRSDRPDLLQGIDVKSSQTVFSRAGGLLSLSNRESSEPFSNEIGVYSFDSHLNAASFETYHDVVKPLSAHDLLDTYSAAYATDSRLPNSEPIEPLDTVSLFYRGLRTRGINGSAFFKWSRFEGVRVETVSKLSKNPAQVLDSSNFFGNVKYDGYIKESVNFELFDDCMTYDTDGILQKSDKRSNARVEVVGGTGGSDRAEAGQFTLFYGGLYR